MHEDIGTQIATIGRIISSRRIPVPRTEARINIQRIITATGRAIMN
jgi:hypothetical protein